MAALGPNFHGALSDWLYRPQNPPGFIVALLIGLLLIVLYVILPAVFALAVSTSWGNGDARQLTKAALVGLFPAGLLTAAIAWLLAHAKGGRPSEVLSLQRPQLGWLGWIAVVAGFLLALYGAVALVVLVFGIDLGEYTPGPEGQSPESGSAGLVKEAMFDIANEPKLFLLVLLSVAVGAPLAEEMVFRGQLFAALSRTPIGPIGATLLTSAVWSILHASEPWLSVGVVFVMGLVLGFLLVRFGSLWVTIACHSAWNAIYSLIIFATIES